MKRTTSISTVSRHLPPAKEAQQIDGTRATIQPQLERGERERKKEEEMKPWMIEVRRRVGSLSYSLRTYIFRYKENDVYKYMYLSAMRVPPQSAPGCE
jgi:hypothetical protein